jgi:hypothetical protein
MNLPSARRFASALGGGASGIGGSGFSSSEASAASSGASARSRWSSAIGATAPGSSSPGGGGLGGAAVGAAGLARHRPGERVALRGAPLRGRVGAVGVRRRGAPREQGERHGEGPRRGTGWAVAGVASDAGLLGSRSRSAGGGGLPRRTLGPGPGPRLDRARRRPSAQAWSRSWASGPSPDLIARSSLAIARSTSVEASRTSASISISSRRSSTGTAWAPRMTRLARADTYGGIASSDSRYFRPSRLLIATHAARDTACSRLYRSCRDSSRRSVRSSTCGYVLPMSATRSSRRETRSSLMSAWWSSSRLMAALAREVSPSQSRKQYTSSHSGSRSMGSGRP